MMIIEVEEGVVEEGTITVMVVVVIMVMAVVIVAAVGSGNGGGAGGEHDMVYHKFNVTILGKCDLQYLQ